MIRLVPALALLAACGSGDDDTAPIDAGPTIVEEARVLLLGQRIEAIMTGGPGDRAVIAVDAPSPSLTWDLHRHAGGDTEIIAMGVSATEIRHELVPTIEDEYFLLLHNTGDAPVDVTIDIDLHGMSWTAFR
jgi:hypothetical protein